MSTRRICAPGATFFGVSLKTYSVWDAPVRWFHWINFVCVVAAAGLGFLFLYRESFLIDSTEAKLAIKAAHIIVGYVLAANLFGRLVWGFIGNRHARWRAVLPNRQSLKELGADMGALVGRKPLDHLGRSPMGRLSTTILFLLLFTLAGTGLFRVATDIFFPVVGGVVAADAAISDVNASNPMSEDEALADRWIKRQVKRANFLFGTVHVYMAYGLLAMIVLHVASAVLVETRRGGGIISAMFSGKKVLSVRPTDADD